MGAIYQAKAVILCTGTYFKGALSMRRSNYLYGAERITVGELFNRFLGIAWGGAASI